MLELIDLVAERARESLRARDRFGEGECGRQKEIERDREDREKVGDKERER